MEDKNYWVAVVDDDPISLKYASELLGGNGIKISKANSGYELLSFIKDNHPDLILMDIMMPGMDGFETYQNLYEFEEKAGRSHTPVIFMTGEYGANIEEKGLMIGASDFIRKPINIEVLLKRVDNILTNREAIENLTEEAMTDKLTGFFNKSYAEQKMIEVCRENRGMLMILDLDNFKLINDLYGHEMGDNIITSFANITRHNCRDKDILCRIGGDEFLAFFVDTTDENIAVAFTQRLNEQLLDACVALMGEDFDIPVGVSVGCVPVTEKGDFNALFHLADRALYQVKLNGRHGCKFYDTDIRTEDEEFAPQQELMKMITLCAERGKAENAMLLGKDSFISIYRYMDRYSRRYNEVTAKVLVYLIADENVDNEEFMDAMAMLGEILQGSLRKNDVITKSGYNSYFLLMAKYHLPSEEVVIERVRRKWEKTVYADKFKIGNLGLISEL